MKRPNKLFRVILILPVLLLVNGCGQSLRNSDTISEFLDKNPRTVKELYFYPSTVRMLGKMMGDEYGTSFKDIKKGRFLYVWDEEEFDLASKFDELAESSKNEGFEVLAEMNNADGKNSIYINDQETPVFLIFLENSFGNYIVELTGDISLNSIYGLTQLDYSSITDNFQSIQASADTIPEAFEDEE